MAACGSAVISPGLVPGASAIVDNPAGASRRARSAQPGGGGRAAARREGRRQPLPVPERERSGRRDGQKPCGRRPFARDGRRPSPVPASITPYRSHNTMPFGAGAARHFQDWRPGRTSPRLSFSRHHRQRPRSAAGPPPARVAALEAPQPPYRRSYDRAGCPPPAPAWWTACPVLGRRHASAPRPAQAGARSRARGCSRPWVAGSGCARRAALRAALGRRPAPSRFARPRRRPARRGSRAGAVPCR